FQCRRTAPLLDIDLPLELQRVANLHKLVRVPRIAVFARELAPAVRVHRPRERHPWSRALVQNRPGLEREVLHVMPDANGFALRRQLGYSNQRGRRFIRHLGVEEIRVFSVSSHIRKREESPEQATTFAFCSLYTTLIHLGCQEASWIGVHLIDQLTLSTGGGVQRPSRISALGQ